MVIAPHKVVSFNYIVSDASTAEVLDSTENHDPLTYLHGAQNIIPGLELAMEGRSQGDQFEVTIAAADAYGEYSEDRVQQVPIQAFDGMEKIEPGVAVTAQTEQGEIDMIITEVEGDQVTVDANHPLAGRSLTFKVTVETIRDASEEEIDHGHAHGPGGYQH